MEREITPFFVGFEKERIVQLVLVIISVSHILFPVRKDGFNFSFCRLYKLKEQGRASLIFIFTCYGGKEDKVL